MVVDNNRKGPNWRFIGISLRSFYNDTSCLLSYLLSFKFTSAVEFGIFRSSLYPRRRQSLGRVFTVVCLSVSWHDISKTDAARINKPDREMFHDESWKPIYFGFRGSKIKVTSHNKSVSVLIPHHCRWLRTYTTLGFPCCNAPPHRPC